MHADRGAQAGQSDLRVDRAMSRLRSQVRQIQQHAAAWAATTLPQYLPPQDLVTSVEKLLFILDKDKVSVRAAGGNQSDVVQLGHAHARGVREVGGAAAHQRH
eukprot:3642160-Rhodomonas_salina.1